MTGMTVPTSRLSAAASRPATAPCLTCRPAASAAELAAHFRIRHQVFVIEQGLFRARHGGPPVVDRQGVDARGDDRDARGDDRDARGDDRDARGDDRDARGDDRDARGDDRDARDDDPATIHVIGLADGVTGGTVRLYPLGGGDGRWKGDRLAVLPEHRRHGLGAPLVRFAVAEAGARGGREMEAYIQPANVAFFEWLGWRRVGRIVEYAGIGHQRMVTGLAARRHRG
jgi:predicted GNAT family N-acyltransferase